MRARHLIAPALLLAAAVPAVAADPESGSVSPSTPKAQWTGTSGGYGITAGNILIHATGQKMVCETPFCDTYTLDVAEGGLNLTVSVTSEESSITQLEVEKPDGSFSYEYGLEPEGAEPNYTTTLKFKKPAKGTWIVRTQSNNAGPTDPYVGVAELTVPTPEPPGGGGGGTHPPNQPPEGGGRPAAPATVTVKALKLSARKVNKRKKIALVVESNGPVSDLQAALRKGGNTIGKGTLASLNGRGRIMLRLSRKLKRGKYTIGVVGRSAGSTVAAGAPVRVRR